MSFLVFVDRRTNAMDWQGLYILKKLFVFSVGIVDCFLSPDIVMMVWWWLINAGRSVRGGARSAPLLLHCHLWRGTKHQVPTVDGEMVPWCCYRDQPLAAVQSSGSEIDTPNMKPTEMSLLSIILLSSHLNIFLRTLDIYSSSGQCVLCVLFYRMQCASL